MNIKKIKELIELMNENDLTEIEVEQEGMKIKLTKRALGAIDQVAAPVAGTKQPPAGGKIEAAPPAEEKRNIKKITAPMVGTFYRSPAPDADPYVEVGDAVKKGDVIGIVEAMKLMNEIKSEYSGKITEITVNNAEPVEFGQTMFLIEVA